MLTSLLSRVDLFGIPVTLSFALQKKSRSVLGGIFSVIFFGFSLWSVIHSSQDLVYRQQPKTIQYDTYNENPRQSLLNSETFPIALGIQGSVLTNFKHFINESIYKMDVYLSRMQRYTENGTSQEVWTDIILETERCDLESFGDSKDKFNTYPLSDLYCIKKQQSGVDEVTIEGGYSSEIYEFLNIGVRRCDNATSNVTCASNEVIDNTMASTWFAMYYVDLSINAKNYTHPDVRFKNNYWTILNPKYTVVTSVMLGHVEMTTDSGWLVQDQKSEDYIKVTAIREYFNSQLDPLGYIFHLTLEADRKETFYTRDYVKLQESLGAAQGLITAVMIAVIIIMYPYSRIKFYESLVNEIFQINIMDGAKDGKDDRLPADDAPRRENNNESSNIRSENDQYEQGHHLKGEDQRGFRDKEKGKTEIKEREVIKTEQNKSTLTLPFQQSNTKR